MSISKEFREAVDTKNLLRVRIMLKDSLLVDPTFAQFEERNQYATENLSDLYKTHDGEILRDDTEGWTVDYMNEQMVRVVGNFSKERIELLKKIVAHLYQDKVKETKAETTVDVQEHSQYSKKQIGTGVAIGGTALALAGVCASRSILIAGGIAVAVAGVVMIVTDEEK